ncbi:tetratricopeptide repeat protein, partial [Kibdelosporangium lantanae]
SRVHLAYSRVFEADHDHERALAYALQAWAIEEDGDQPLRQADVLNQMGRTLAKSQRYPEALPIIQQALALYAQVHHKDGQADALVTIGDIKRALGDHAEAVESYRASLDLDRELGDRYWEARVLGQLGRTYLDMCDTARARVAFHAAQDIFTDIHPAKAEQIADVLRDL